MRFDKGLSSRTLDAGTGMWVAFVFALVGVAIASQQPVSAQGGFQNSHWRIAPSYPTPIWAESCVASGGYVYCVGGLTGNDTSKDATNAVYSAQVTSSGVSGWTQTTSYPVRFRSGSCVTSSSTVYCIGGYTQSSLSSSVYYASLSSGTVSAWKQTTSYALPIWVQSCASSALGIYCVGGNDASQQQISDVYFAPFSGSGIGQWQKTTSYPQPVREESCVASDTYLYCVGGYASKSTYYAPLTQTGIGQWKQTVTYPVSTAVNSPSCMISSGILYCVGGYDGAAISNLVYSTNASSRGFGPFIILPGYPHVVWAGSCVFAQDTIVCIGGGSKGGSTLQDVRYLQGSGQGPTSAASSTTSSSTAPTSIVETSSGSSGGIPEFPYIPAAAAAVAIVIVGSYLAARRHA